MTILNVPIVVHDRQKRNKIQVDLSITERDTIKTVLSSLSSRTGIPHDQLSPVLCGRILDDSTPIKDLLLGPTTSLVVLADSSARSRTSFRVSETPQIGSFYLWCKRCDDLTRGKIRVYCSNCSSSAVIVEKDPSGWEDVLKSKRIKVQCDDCQNSWADFRFKCTSCNELAAPLSQVRGNWERSPCIVCTEENEKFVFDLGCHTHPMCRRCFKQYAETSLKEGKFSFQVPYGYTIGCATSGCDYYVKDAHCFRILGDEKYQMYQHQATEKLVALHDQGVRCPFTDCNSYFFWENDNDEDQVYCPNCFRQFCHNCKSRECTCDNPDELSHVTIAASSKKCPGCNADTTREGGCAHMRCTNCGLNWCYRCVLPWTDECQWDHWFS